MPPSAAFIAPLAATIAFLALVKPCDIVVGIVLNIFKNACHFPTIAWSITIDLAKLVRISIE